jgi:hypothetical protein
MILLCICALSSHAQSPTSVPPPFAAEPKASQAQQQNYSPQLLEQLASIKAAAMSDDVFHERAVHGSSLACRKQRAQLSHHFDAAVRGSHGGIDGAVKRSASSGKDQSGRQQPHRVLQRGEITRYRRIRG